MKRRGRSVAVLGAVLWAMLWAAGCTWTVEPRVSARLSEPVAIRPGWTVVWPEAKLSLVFERVVGDDRCPRQVICEWAGEARLQVVVEVEGYPLRRFQMSTYPYFGEDLLVYAGYTIRLTDVTPYPELPNEERDEGDYRITLVAAAASTDPLSVTVGSPFTLRLGQMARMEEVDLSLTWQSLLADSRCPTMVTCVWAGEARLSVTWAHQGMSGRAEVTSNADAGAAELEVGAYRVRLLGVTPAPVWPDEPIRQEEYATRWVIETP